MILAEEEELEFCNADTCYICEREFKCSDSDNFGDFFETEYETVLIQIV